MTKFIVFLGVTVAACAANGAPCPEIGTQSERLSCYDEAVRCGAIRNDDERLACFDRELAGRIDTSGTADDTGNPNAGMPPAARRSSPPPSPVKESPAPASAPAPTALAEENFGRAKQEPDEITATLAGTFDGWEGKERFELTNGQVWEVRRANSARYYSPVSEPNVVIRKNFLGFYVMDVPEADASVPVTRVD